MEVMTEMTVRMAVPDDMHKVVELGRRFLLEGPYRGELEDNPEKATQFACSLLQHPSGRILVADDGEKVVGVFAFFAYDHLFSGELTAVELIWYVEPESRPGGIALKLLAAGEKMAREMGCVKMQLTAPTEEVGNLYRYCGGYKKIEVSYQRKL